MAPYGTRVGTCGNCGGNVILQEIQWRCPPAPPRCDKCGATPAIPDRVLPMNPARVQRGRKL